MTTQNITFTKKSLNNNTVEIEEINFPVSGSEKKITKITLTGSEGDKLKNIINSGSKFKLTFEDSEVETDDENSNLDSKGGGRFTAGLSAEGTDTASAGHFTMNSSEASGSGNTRNFARMEKEGKKQKNSLTVVDETLWIAYMNEGGSIKLEAVSETDQTEESGKGPNQKGPGQDEPEENKPTDAEINQVKTKLTNANTLAEITEAFKESENLKKKNLSSSQLSEIETLENAARDKLYDANKPSEYCQLAETEITNKLSEYGISETELDGKEKAELAKLKNKETTGKDKIDEDKKGIIQNIVKKGTDKKWTALQNEAQAALNSKDKTKLTKAETDLNAFIKDNKYSAKKSDAQSLLNQVKNANKKGGGGKGNENEKTSWYRNPKVMIPVALGGVAIIALAIWFVRSNRSSHEE